MDHDPNSFSRFQLCRAEEYLKRPFGCYCQIMGKHERAPVIPQRRPGDDNPAGCYVGTWPVGTVTLSSSRPPAPPPQQRTTSTTWGRSKRRALLLTLPNRHHPKEGFALVVLRVIKRIDARVQLSRTEELKWTSNHRIIKNVVIKKKGKKNCEDTKEFSKKMDWHRCSGSILLCLLALLTIVPREVKGFVSCSPNPCENEGRCIKNSLGSARCE